MDSTSQKSQEQDLDRDPQRDQMFLNEKRVKDRRNSLSPKEKSSIPYHLTGKPQGLN